MVNDIGDIKSLINQQGLSEIKKSILITNSRNLCEFINNFWTIKLLYELEPKNIEFTARWLRMFQLDSQLDIDWYFNYLSSYEKQGIKTN